MDFIVKIYGITEMFPQGEMFGLTSQLRRASISIASNIAEGAARKSQKEFIQFLYIAKGSISEIDTQIEIAYRLGYVGKAEYEEMDAELEEIDKMLSGLVRSLN